MLRDLFPSRFAMAAGIGCAVFIPLAVVASYQWGVTHRDLVQEKQRASELHDAIHAEGTGYAARLTTCGANLAGASAALSRQNGEVARLKTDADAATARAQAAVGDALARARSAEQRAQSLLIQQPRDGESRCEAADRLILEHVQ